MFNLTIGMIFRVILVFLIIVLCVATVKLFGSLGSLLSAKSITGSYKNLIADIFTLYILIELARTLAEYFHTHRLRLSFIVDAAIVFILRDIMMLLYMKNYDIQLLYVLTVMLLVDLSGSQFFGSQQSLKRDVAVELSAILAFSAMKNNDKVGAILFSDKIERFIPPRKGQSHALRIIRELLSYEPSRSSTSIRAGLEYLNHVQKKRSIVFLISDFMDDGYQAALRIAGKRHDLVGVVLTDPRELELPPVGLVPLRDAETSEVRWVDTSDRSVRDAYRAHRAAAERSRQSVFVTSRLDAIDIRLDRPSMKPLVDFFRKREKRW